MSIASEIQSIGFLTDLRESALVYPIVMATHLACIALFGGMVVLTDLRLLGVALTSTPVSDVVNGLKWWKRLGFVIIVTCGLLLGTSEAEKSQAELTEPSALVVGVGVLMTTPLLGSVVNWTCLLNTGMPLRSRTRATRNTS